VRQGKFAVISKQVGYWVSEQQYSELFSIAPKRLRQWRWMDHKVGRTSAREGYPIYRKVGGLIRYLVIETLEGRGRKSKSASALAA